MEKKFYYKIKEVHTEEDSPVQFRAPSAVSYQDNWLELLATRAALIYFYGQGGWECKHGWPLTFMFSSSEGFKLGEAIVFILTGTDPPLFDVIW